MRLKFGVKLSPRAMKGVVILSVAAMLLLFFAILPWVWHASLSWQAASQRAELDLVRARVQAQAERRGPVLTERDRPQAMFLPGKTAGTTLAAFQSFVGEAATASGMSVLRLQPLPTDETGGLSPYRLAVDVAGSLEQLRTFLLGLETMLPVVIVSGFEIVPRSTGGVELQPYPSEELAISLRLEAYAWRGLP